MKKQALLITLLLASSLLHGQSKIQSPSQFLGYELGTQFTRHHQVIDYFEYLAQESDMVQLTQYGETYEKRPLIALYISNAENIKKAEDIRIDNLRRAGLASGNATSEKAIVWLGYNVHGNESVSTEASMKTAFELITNRKEWLKDIVVVMDPCINPDGRERYVNFYWQYGNAPYNTDPLSYEHREGWVSGRANHYMFDLNRDWAWLTQQESRGRVALYNKWMPQIAVDFHEQGVNAPYYFPPAAEPYHKRLSTWQKEFQQIIGKNHAKWFDKNGWFYFTDEFFDLLYPSYGDTYPSLNGSIGMTYEQGGSGRAGLGVITGEGDTLTLKDRIAHHYTTGLSTIEVAAQERTKLLSEFEKFNDDTSTSAKTFVLKAAREPYKARQLTQWLDKLDIQYKGVQTSKSLKGTSFSSRRSATFNAEPGDIVISTNQPKSAFVQALFEAEAQLSDSVTYDITAWSVPYANGFEAYSVSTPLTNLTTYKEEAFVQNSLEDTPYAYLCEWNDIVHAEWMSLLIKNGIIVRVSDKAFRFKGIDFQPGSMVISRKGNERLGVLLDEIVTTSAASMRIKIHSTPTGFSQSGVDIGSSSVRMVNAPKVALFAGDGASSLAVGETWYFFEQVLKYPVSMLKTSMLNKRNLDSYDVIILQNGGYQSMPDSYLETLKQWATSGGRLIVVQNAIRSFLSDDAFDVTSSYDEEEDQEPQRDVKFGDLERDGISDIISGAIYRTHLDNTHPLGYGYGEQYFTLKTTSIRAAPLRQGRNIGTIKNSSDKLSGFVGYRASKLMENSLVFGVEPIGDGSVTYMVDNPLFRAFWKNGHLIFANAVFINDLSGQ